MKTAFKFWLVAVGLAIGVVAAGFIARMIWRAFVAGWNAAGPNFPTS